LRGLDQEVDPAVVDADSAVGYVEGVDSSVLVDPIAVRELLARRRFAVPTVVTSIDGGEEIELNPADEEQRELLILAEHPEYTDAVSGQVTSYAGLRSRGDSYRGGCRRR